MNNLRKTARITLYRTVFAEHVAWLFAFVATGCISHVELAGERENGPYVEVGYDDAGLTATASRGQSHVTIDFTQRLHEGTELLAEPVSMSTHVTDIRVENRRGYPFLVIGDGAFAAKSDHDVGVKEGESSASDIATQDEQLEDLFLVLEAADVLRESGDISERYGGALDALERATNAALDNANAVYDGRIPLDGRDVADASIEGIDSESTEEPDNVDVRRGLLTAENGFIQNFFIMYTPSFWIYGDHSAVKIDVYRMTGEYVGYVSTRNHGTEADDPKMRVSPGCPRAFYGRPTALPPMQPHAAADTAFTGDAGGCPTPYRWYGRDAHVCNDDSLAMRDMAVRNRAIPAHATCADGRLRHYAPGCY